MIYGLVRPFLPRGYHRYPVADGRLYLNLHESPLMLARVLRTYERPKMKAMRQHLRSGDICADVGANKGDFSLLAARQVGPSGRVLSIEPESENFRWLMRSVAGLNQVECVQVALGREVGEASLRLGAKSGAHSLSAAQPLKQTGAENVHVSTLDTLTGGRLDVAKIDVEGFEVEVLAGAQESLQNLRALFLDLHPSAGVNTEEVMADLVAKGFTLFTSAGERTKPVPRIKEVVALRQS